MIDTTVTNHGTLFTFELHTDAAREWVRGNIEIADYMWRGADTFACEHRYAGDLAAGMVDAGLEVS